ncbi:MAG: putative glycoside hydrolase [Firmicutes bacterium]|nr:putative glycoside hydrolase [Bacillota bacterium]
MKNSKWLLFQLTFFLLSLSAPLPEASALEKAFASRPITTYAELRILPKPEPPRSERRIAKLDWPKPPEIKGIYATAWMAGSPKWFPRLVQFINETEFNAIVIDVKDDTGTLSYRSQVEMVNQIKASENKIPDPEAMIRTLYENQIYPIARIVAFKDPLLARKKPEWAVGDIDGGIWKDRKGLNWVDPYNRELWDYLVAIAEEAIALGFQEIQFDYVRFTSDGDTKRCVYPYNTGESRADAIENFLKYARAKLRPYQIPVSADVFGLTVSVPDDQGIGQQFEKIFNNVDIVCPMVYPSHYAAGAFGLKDPNRHPYETVFQGVSDAKKRMEQAGNTSTILRPWLQDFSLGHRYHRDEIQAQIKAVRDAGIKEWIFWNPSCRYDLEKYN